MIYQGSVPLTKGSRGSLWYSGTAITGTSTTPAVYSTEITKARVNDCYLNTETSNVYQCTSGGNASTALWKYVGNIKGGQGEQGEQGENGLNNISTGTTTSLSGLLFGNGTSVSAVTVGTQVITGYQKASESSALSATDTINQALGKLEKMAEAAEVNLISISASALSTNTGFNVGDSISNGIKVMATYSNGTVSETTDYTIQPANVTSFTEAATISYTFKDVTKTTIFLPTPKDSIEDCSWATISALSNIADNYFSVGDTKTVTVNGSIGASDICNISNISYNVYILGFNHNSAYEGSNNGITFGCFKTTDGISVCLVDSNYGSTYTSGTHFNMNHNSNTNVGGWKACNLRYDILGSTNTSGVDAPTNTATSPKATTLMAALPSDLRSVMKPMTIYTDNTGNSSNVAANVTATTDYLPLLSEYEVFGVRSYANQYEQDKQAQYAYYAAGNAKTKYKHNATINAAIFWERSAYYDNTAYFCSVYSNGSAVVNDAYYSFGVAPCFRV